MPLFQLVVSTGLSQTVPVETPLTAKASTPSMRWGRLRWRQGVGEVRLAPPSPPRLPPCWPPRRGKIWCPLYCLAAALGGRAVVEFRSLCELYQCGYSGHFQIWSHSHIVHTWKLSPQQPSLDLLQLLPQKLRVETPQQLERVFCSKTLFSITKHQNKPDSKTSSPWWKNLKVTHYQHSIMCIMHHPIIPKAIFIWYKNLKYDFLPSAKQSSLARSPGSPGSPKPRIVTLPYSIVLRVFFFPLVFLSLLV